MGIKRQWNQVVLFSTSKDICHLEAAHVSCSKDSLSTPKPDPSPPAWIYDTVTFCNMPAAQWPGTGHVNQYVPEVLNVYFTVCGPAMGAES